jgi:hypothetical protein
LSGDQINFKILDASSSELIEMDVNGEAIWEDFGISIISLTEKVILPTSFVLETAYPNPFNPSTTLSFALPIEAEISIKIYNMQGREVGSLINGIVNAGYHSVVWNADGYASGMYFVTMQTNEYVKTQKLMLLK